ncbi:hypothetical protein DUI87_24221 [Hirundo rustica rustica]|uniref:Core shell protein Gag P30 domain-containing protein n=1 Tax=Hirundo rustica rustica TaxID=333673 RepID=A0A3M0JFA3_HIRRU|nr:hypothetical protein DUI87_24221 [Hirundo rustica rustica]
MLEQWDKNERTKPSDQIKMIHYCVEVWPTLDLPGKWPWQGTTDPWMCSLLNRHLRAQANIETEQIKYAACWLEPNLKDKRVKICKVQEQGKKSDKKKEEEHPTWDPLDHLPPPSIYRDIHSSPQHLPANPPPISRVPPNPVSSPLPSTLPAPPPDWGLSLPMSSPETSLSNNHSGGTPTQGIENLEGPCCNTRSKVKLFPLREVVMGGAAGGVGFVNAPLTASEVRNFKKELGNLVEDPIGVLNQIDQFLGPNIYTWGELNSILKILFSLEEGRMIRAAGMRIWERGNRTGPPGDFKLPVVDPRWNPNREEDRRNMEDYQNLIVRGIKESVPRSNNTKLAFDSMQGKEETPATWLNRLKRNFQLYSNIDPDSPEGQILLKTQIVTKSWPDIRRKLEKIEDWQEKGINELL